jgi:hypothetical protein
MEVSTLRPGLLVSLKTSISGNVKYSKRTIEADHYTGTGAKLAVWETERAITDPAEHEGAQKARQTARMLISRICSKSAFGMLCPEEKAAQLDEAIRDARAVADAFNATAGVTRLGVYIMTGRVAQDDVEAVRAINSEVRDLLSEMQEGLQNLDVKQVREAAQKAKGLGQMLSEEASEKVKVAVELARKSAREIVKAGEGVTVEIDRATIKRIESQRVAFLDLDSHAEVATPKAAARNVEFAPENDAA